MKLKMKTLVAACALALTSQAHALAPTTVPDVTMFLSGSSALQNAIGQIGNDLFVAGTEDVFYDGTATVPNGGSYRAYFGTFKTGTTSAGIVIPASLAGKKVLIYNTGAGGSIKGVNPVALAQPVTRLNLASCVASVPAVVDSITATTIYTCPTTVTTAVPDAGVSDVEPALLTGINLTINAATALTTRTPTATALTATQLANLVPTTALGQPMGIIVTSNATPAMLNLSKAQVAALMSGASIFDWNQIDATVAAGTTSVVVCRRQPGSGTQASINNAIFGFPCAASQLAPADATVDAALTLGTSTPVPGGSYVVVENSSSGALAACMTAAQNGTMVNAVGKQAIDVTSGALVALNAPNSVVLPAGGYGIGLMGFDRPAKAGELYQFASINGAAPTLANATTGVYDIMVENAFVRRAATTAGILPMSGAQLDLYNTFVSAAGKPAVLGLAGHIVPGVAALSENGNTAPAVFDPANPVMRVGNTGNSCTPLQTMQ
jgi:copper(I)-binding protein